MNSAVVILGVLAVGILFAPAPLTPSPGEVCYNWHATTQGPNGNMMTCTHLPDSGHIMYWEYGGPRDTG
jgi:hypothetical protein